MCRVKAADWDTTWAGRLGAPAREPNRTFAEAVAGVRPARALDLACGAGRHSVWLAQQGWAVTGVDFSAVALAAARERAAQAGVSVDWIEADVTTYEPPGDAFDLVCILYLQLPGLERRAVLERAWRALAPGGTLVVLGHHADNRSEGHGGPSSSDVLYSEHDIASELGRGEIVRAERVIRIVDTEDGPREAIDALVVARRDV
jgi:SAM-dependent methyltransferase